MTGNNHPHILFRIRFSPDDHPDQMNDQEPENIKQYDELVGRLENQLKNTINKLDDLLPQNLEL